MAKRMKDRRKFYGAGPRFKPHHGFWTTTPNGRQVHIKGDPAMPEETLQALCRMMDLVYQQFSAKEK
jgi:hypothetical protein